MCKRLNTDIFVKRSQEIHGDKYDYSLTNYVSAHKKVKIICKQHGVFEQKAWNHLHNDGCPICYGTKKYTKEEFIEKSNKTHLNKYDYSLVDYVNNSTKVKIICNQHGVFEQSPSSHVSQRHGCPSCNISKGEIFIQNFLSEKNILELSKYEIESMEIICKIIMYMESGQLETNINKYIAPFFNLKKN